MRTVGLAGGSVECDRRQLDVGLELTDPLEDPVVATEALVPYLARGGPIDQVSQMPSAGAYTNASLLVMGDVTDPAGRLVAERLAEVSNQMLSVPADLSTVGLVIEDIAL